MRTEPYQLMLPLLSVYEAMVLASPLVRVYYKNGQGFWQMFQDHLLDWQLRTPDGRLSH